MKVYSSKKLLGLDIILILFLFVALFLSLTIPTPSLAQSSNLTIGNYILINKTRVGQTDYEYTFKANITNNGTIDLINVSATLTSSTDTIIVIENSLTFGSVYSGVSITSEDTFTVRINRRYPFNESNLNWQILSEERPLLDGAVFLPEDTVIETATFQYEIDGEVVEVEAAVGRVVVQFNSETSENLAESIISSNGGEIVEKIPVTDLYVAKVAHGEELIFLDKMQSNPHVDFADLDFILSDAAAVALPPTTLPYTSNPNEDIFAQNSYLQTIKAPEAWGWLKNNKTIADNDEKISIGIIDRGFYDVWFNSLDDFKDRLVPVGDNLGKGNHGSMVTSVASAMGNNNYGNIGINWTSKIIIICPNIYKDLFFYYGILSSIEPLIDRGVKVINISHQQRDQLVERIFLEHIAHKIKKINKNTTKEFIVINAAGNMDFCLGKIEKPDNFIIVGGSNGNQRDEDSSYGESIDIVAPYTVQRYYDYGTGAIAPDPISGTSLSAPMVAGAAALIWAFDDTLTTAKNVVQRLKDTADGTGGISDFPNAGILNIYAALTGKDSDNDGVSDGYDKCPNTPLDEIVDASGCSVSQIRPNVPILSYPENKANISNPANFNFEWEGVTGDGIEYCIAINEDSEPDIPVYKGCELWQFSPETCLNISDLPISLEQNKTYYWSVKAKDENGTWSEASEWWSFTTMASSAPCQIPDTGQIQSYTDTFGEDSDYTINPHSYTKLDAQGNPLPDTATSWDMVRDNVTGLMWQKSIAGPMNWYAAISYCENLTLGGYTDWRLPTIKELSFIVDSGRHDPTIDTEYFDTMSFPYWSSTTNANNSDSAWRVYFDQGFVIYYYKSSGYYVRAVRGGQSVFDAFVDNGNGTVTDTCTDLMWQKDTAGEMNWFDAISYCENLTLGGHTDWRLPNRNELQSLVDYTRYAPTIDTTAFPNTMLFPYWSSTTNVKNSDFAWCVYFGNGNVHDYNKSNGYYKYVRAVRGGR